MTFNNLSRLMRVITHSNNVDIFCRNAIHNLLGASRFSAAAYFTIALDGNLEQSGGYAIAPEFMPDKKIPVTSSHPAAETIRDGLPCVDNKKYKAISVPVGRDGWTFGVLVLHPTTPEVVNINPDSELLALGQALSIFIEGNSAPRNKLNLDPDNQKPEQLSPRQIQILQGMADGLIYGQIASNLHVSESLVKQEASKIFRFLGVSGRSEAIAAGRKLLDALATPLPSELTPSLRNQ